MRNDTHFIITGEDVQILSGQNQTVACGKEIERAQVQPIWDDFAVNSKFTLPEETVAFCQKCCIAVMQRSEAGPRKIWAVSRRREDEHNN